jgi:hypothetical protein
MEAFQTVYIPKQTPRKAYNLEGMKAVITSYPPLGQVTLVEGTTTTFMILLETDKSRATNAWEASLWHSRGEEWQEQELKSVNKTADLPLVIQTSNETSTHHLYFTTTVEIVSPMSFTIKFRTAPDEPWRWVKDQQGVLDGTLLSRSKIPKSRTEDLSDLIKGLNPIVKATKVLSQSPDTSVWSLTDPVEAADGEKSAMVDIKFGLPWAGKILRYGYFLMLLPVRQYYTPNSMPWRRNAKVILNLRNFERSLVLLMIYFLPWPEAGTNALTDSSQMVRSHSYLVPVACSKTGEESFCAG